MIKAIATSVAQYVTVKTFAAALRGLVVEELVPTWREKAARCRALSLSLLTAYVRGGQDGLQPRCHRQ